MHVRYACEDLDRRRRRVRDLEREIDRRLDAHEGGRLLTTIAGSGPPTSARLGTTFGDAAGFRSGAALAAYVGVLPALRQSGQRTSPPASLTPGGAARLRATLWMPVRTAVRKSPWLRAYYQGLIARGKPPKVALVAAMRKLRPAASSGAIARRPFVPDLVAVETPR